VVSGKTVNGAVARDPIGIGTSPVSDCDMIIRAAQSGRALPLPPAGCLGAVIASNVTRGRPTHRCVLVTFLAGARRFSGHSLSPSSPAAGPNVGS